jgi:polyhydroxybutyrate depolymerase
MRHADKLLTRRLAIATLLLVGGSCVRISVGENGEWKPGTQSHAVDVQGDERDYLLHVPASRSRNRFGFLRRYPVVIALHGSGADGETIERQSAFDSVSEANGWLVAYPNGTTGPLGVGSDWNAGTCCGVAARNSVNDVQFILAIIDSLASRFPINRGRVYVAGFSDGARMAYHLACDAASSFAAVSIVSGSLRDPKCAPAKPVPLIAFHGTDDDEVSYTERPTLWRPRELQSVLPPSVQMWASDNGCSGLMQSKTTKDVTRYFFSTCRAAVEFYAVAGGGHGWPGERDGVGAESPMSEISATDLMVQFFNRN